MLVSKRARFHNTETANSVEVNVENNIKKNGRNTYRVVVLGSHSRGNRYGEGSLLKEIRFTGKKKNSRLLACTTFRK